MNQDLYLQNHTHPPQQQSSFFECFNCFAKPEIAESFIAQQPAYLRNQKNKYTYPSSITQEAQKQEAFSSNNHSMLNSRTSIKNNNKRETISLRRSRKVISHYQHNILSLKPPQLKQLPVNTAYPAMHHNLLLQPSSSNLPSSRLSVPHSIISSEVPSSIKRRTATKPSITFSYKLPVPNTNNNSSVGTSMVAKQLNQNMSQIKAFKQTDSVMGNSEASISRELPSGDKLSEFYPSKEKVESLQLQGRKVSSGSKETNNNLKKSGGGRQGKLQFQIRQTISIKQPEEEDLHESIVLADKNFTHHEGPLDSLLKPIRESEPELQSLIGSFRGNMGITDKQQQ